MTHVATLIASPGALDPQTIARAATVLAQAQPPRWLSEGEAVDIAFTAERDDLRDIADAARAAASGPVDVVVQPVTDRRKRLFLADMDSTMITQECIDELADVAGLKPKVADITERAMRGEIAFEPALRERVALLKGLPSSIAAELLRTRITLTPGANTLIATMRAHGTHTCLVTGGFTLFADAVVQMLGFDECRANTLHLDDNGQFSGTVADPIFGREGKRETLIGLRQRLGLAPIDTMATGDGANDIAMIAEAGLGVAYHAKPKVAAEAHARIDHCDLTALLYVQGYRRDEFV